jgi:hypothetical protein
MADALYLPKPIGQLTAKNPDAYQYAHFDCWATTGAWLEDGATAGATHLAPAAIRHAAGKDRLGPANDGAGGLEDIRTALATYGTTFQLQTITAAAAKAQLALYDGRLYGIPVHMDEWPSGKSCRPDFTGRHMIGVVPGMSPAKLVRVMDPLCNRWTFVPLDGLITAMLGYAEHHTSDTPRGSVRLGHVWRPKALTVAAPPAPPIPSPSPPLPVADRRALPSGASLRAWPDSSAPVIRRVAGGGLLGTGAMSTGTGWEVASPPGSWWLEVLLADGQPCEPPLWVAPEETAPLA